MFGHLEKSIALASMAYLLNNLEPVWMVAEVYYGDIFALTNLRKPWPLGVRPDVTFRQRRKPVSGGQQLCFHGVIYARTDQVRKISNFLEGEDDQLHYLYINMWGHLGLTPYLLLCWGLLATAFFTFVTLGLDAHFASLLI